MANINIVHYDRQSKDIKVVCVVCHGIPGAKLFVLDGGSAIGSDENSSFG